MNWKLWLKGLAAAAIGGAAGGTGAAISQDKVSGTAIGISAGISALIAVVGYLKQSPLQPFQPQVPPMPIAGMGDPADFYTKQDRTR